MNSNKTRLASVQCEARFKIIPDEMTLNRLYQSKMQLMLLVTCIVGLINSSQVRMLRNENESEFRIYVDCLRLSDAGEIIRCERC